MTTPKPDKTRNERQQRRRKIEKEWLNKYGFKSWEALHTKLMNGDVVIVNPVKKVKL